MILLDIVMPGIDGFDVYRHLKKDSKTKDIPIIFVTIKDELEYLIKGFNLGATDFIIKPFTKYEILARVKPHTQLYRLKKILSRDVNALNPPLTFAPGGQKPFREKVSGLPKAFH